MTAEYPLRSPRPGDLGWIVHRNGVLHAQEQDGVLVGSVMVMRHGIYAGQGFRRVRREPSTKYAPACVSETWEVEL